MGIRNGQIRLTRFIPCILTLICIAAGCAKNPVSGKRELALISESQEIAFGREAHPQILAQFGTIEDESLQAYFTRIGKELAALSHRPNLPWQFTVVDSAVPNAFAVPGGFIYFTRGILVNMNNEAELAGVLGHEIGHVTARHSVSQISRQQLYSLGLGIGAVLSPAVRQLGDLAQFGLGILFLKYSREDESEADQLGVRYMLNASYDPMQLSRFFELFQRMRESSSQTLPDWLSSHPAPTDRVRATEQTAADLLQGHSDNLKVGRNDLLQHLDGLVYGENPREGYVKDGRFLHPDLRFQLDLPVRWQVNNSKTSVVILEPNQQAAIQLTLVPSGAGQTLEEASRNLADLQGVTMLHSESLEIHGNPSFQGRYRIQQADGSELTGLITLISFRENLYQLAGLAPTSLFENHFQTLRTTAFSFGELRDPEALKIQPDRIKVVGAGSGDTLRQLHGRYSSDRVTVEELSLLNRLDPDRQLESGLPVKVVVPGSQ